MLSDPVDPRDGLKLKRRVEEGLAEEDVAGVDKVETTRVRFRVQDEYLYTRVLLEVFDPIWPRDRCVSDAVPVECVLEDTQEIGEPGEELATGWPRERD